MFFNYTSKSYLNLFNIPAVSFPLHPYKPLNWHQPYLLRSRPPSNTSYPSISESFELYPQFYRSIKALLHCGFSKINNIFIESTYLSSPNFRARE